MQSADPSIVLVVGLYLFTAVLVGASHVRSERRIAALEYRIMGALSEIQMQLGRAPAATRPKARSPFRKRFAPPEETPQTVPVEERA